VPFRNGVSVSQGAGRVRLVAKTGDAPPKPREAIGREHRGAFGLARPAVDGLLAERRAFARVSLCSA
jgi:hypothetical protein